MQKKGYRQPDIMQTMPRFQDKDLNNPYNIIHIYKIIFVMYFWFIFFKARAVTFAYGKTIVWLVDFLIRFVHKKKYIKYENNKNSKNQCKNRIIIFWILIMKQFLDSNKLLYVGSGDFHDFLGNQIKNGIIKSLKL